MSNRRQKRRIAGPGALPAILAVLALLLQGLAPGMAVAASGGTRTVVLCTSMGEKTVTVPDDSAPRPMSSSKCHDCVMVAVTTVMPPSPDSLPVRYAAVVRHELALAAVQPVPTRPPPRPPGQGPPSVS